MEWICKLILRLEIMVICEVVSSSLVDTNISEKPVACFYM
jgi:hypothetical protein